MKTYFKEHFEESGEFVFGRALHRVTSAVESWLLCSSKFEILFILSCNSSMPLFSLLYFYKANISMQDVHQHNLMM